LSRGLGKLQREILDTLEDAKRYFADPAQAVERQFLGITFKSFPSYLGSAPIFRDGDPRQLEPGWVQQEAGGFRIPETVYDLRASCRYLAIRHNAAYCVGIEGRFQASFSRAVRSLVSRGALHHLRCIVPVVAVDTFRPPRTHELADGTFVDTSPKQVRFVTR
jgi:hypothetical protein